MTDQDKLRECWLTLGWNSESIPSEMIADAMKEKKPIHQYMFEFDLEEWIRDIDKLKPGWRKSPDLLAMVNEVLKKIDEK